jgi:hypothetical protein
VGCHTVRAAMASTGTKRKHVAFAAAADAPGGDGSEAAGAALLSDDLRARMGMSEGAYGYSDNAGMAAVLPARKKQRRGSTGSGSAAALPALLAKHQRTGPQARARAADEDLTRKERRTSKSQERKLRKLQVRAATLTAAAVASQQCNPSAPPWRRRSPLPPIIAAPPCSARRRKRKRRSAAPHCTRASSARS